MNWKDIDLRHDTGSIPSLAASAGVKNDLFRRLFPGDEVGARAEAYLKEHWSALTGSAGVKSTPGRLEGGILHVKSSSGSVNQEIQLRLLKIKGELSRRTGYELKGFRFEHSGEGGGPGIAVAGKRHENRGVPSDKKPDGENSPFVEEIRRVLGLK